PRQLGRPGRRSTAGGRLPQREAAALERAGEPRGGVRGRIGLEVAAGGEPVVVDEPGEGTLVVARGAIAGRGAAPERVEERLVADHVAPDGPESRCVELVRQALDGHVAAPVVAVHEALAPEGGVAAPHQVQVPLHYAARPER